MILIALFFLHDSVFSIKMIQINLIDTEERVGWDQNERSESSPPSCRTKFILRDHSHPFCHHALKARLWDSEAGNPHKRMECWSGSTTPPVWYPSIQTNVQVLDQIVKELSCRPEWGIFCRINPWPDFPDRNFATSPYLHRPTGKPR
jgi:hypothetical protein